jgi:hypothetical protein
LEILIPARGGTLERVNPVNVHSERSGGHRGDRHGEGILDVLAGIVRALEGCGEDDRDAGKRLGEFDGGLQKVILPRFGLSLAEISDTLTLEEVKTMLAESGFQCGYAMRAF